MLTLHKSNVNVQVIACEDGSELVVLTHRDLKLRVSRDTAEAYAMALLAAAHGGLGPSNSATMSVDAWRTEISLPHGDGCACNECNECNPYTPSSTRDTECCEHNVPLEHADFCRMCCAAQEPVILEPPAILESPGPCAVCNEAIEALSGDGWVVQAAIGGDEVIHQECWNAMWGARFPEPVGC